VIWYNKSTPEQIQAIPWLHPEAIAYLESLLTPKMEVIEHGGGGSTLWFASKVKTITTYENDPDWARVIQSQAPANVTLKTSERVGPPFDLMLVDGEPIYERCFFLSVAHRIIKAGGWVVLDNANRPEYANERKDLYKHFDLIHTVDGNDTGTRYLVTEFYRKR
jgi:predicted O-methyltransferase YrrM